MYAYTYIYYTHAIHNQGRGLYKNNNYIRVKNQPSLQIHPFRQPYNCFMPLTHPPV